VRQARSAPKEDRRHRLPCLPRRFSSEEKEEEKEVFFVTYTMQYKLLVGN
jgi:hypothetical protein